MTKMLTLEVPDGVLDALRAEATRMGKSPEQIGLECITQHARVHRPGTPAALKPFSGAWSMTDEERGRIERMIDKERHDDEHF